MKSITGFCRLIIFALLVLSGIQIPGFVDQYGKSLQAHYLESKISLAEFQDDADKYFNGSMEQLITHYRESADPVFKEGGASIDAIMQRHFKLREAWQQFQEDVYSPYIQVLTQPIQEIRKEVWENHTYTVVLDRTAITIGLLLAAVIYSLVFGLTAIFVRLIRQPGTHHKKSPATAAQK